MSKLNKFHSKSGIFFDDFIEKTFGWQIQESYFPDSKDITYKRKWIGVWHNPPNAPEWFDRFNSPQAVLKRKVFQDSLNCCKAIVCLSEYFSSWVRDRIDVPVVTVKHPTEIPLKKWNIQNFIRTEKKELVQIGYWLRKMNSIHMLKCDHNYKKKWLPSNEEYAIELYDTHRRTMLENHEMNHVWAGVGVENVSNKEFDDLLSRCIVFVDLYDSSANNAIVESIARNTPILVNRIPATEEYLGKDYPLYFNDLDHASSLLYDFDSVYNAHKYLKEMDKRWISGEYFANDLITKLQSVI
jgi:hypothetical protein